MSLHTCLAQNLTKDLVKMIDIQLLHEICNICQKSIFNAFSATIECAICGEYFHPLCHKNKHSQTFGVCNKCVSITHLCFLCNDVFSGSDEKYGGQKCRRCKKTAHHFCRRKFQTFCNHNPRKKTFSNIRCCVINY